jgi:2-keto-4-pentenoate hydratase/2-oxohepta-3-ene-1,7-dioic acid hydratase in catechol pathway
VRLVVFRRADAASESWRLGSLVEGDRIVDLAAADTARGQSGTHTHNTPAFEHFPGTVVELLEAPGGLGRAAAAARWAVQTGDLAPAASRILHRESECVLDAPVRPSKLITIARNYREHLAESGVSDVGPVPSASIKATSSLTGPYDDIVRPLVESRLDYETELAIVIGVR